MVAQQLRVLRNSAKMFVEQERMETIHGGLYVSWTGPREAGELLLDISC